MASQFISWNNWLEINCHGCARQSRDWVRTPFHRVPIVLCGIISYAASSASFKSPILSGLQLSTLFFRVGHKGYVDERSGEVLGWLGIMSGFSTGSGSSVNWNASPGVVASFADRQNADSGGPLGISRLPLPNGIASAILPVIRQASAALSGFCGGHSPLGTPEKQSGALSQGLTLVLSCGNGLWQAASVHFSLINVT
jgi:hypothetical protein